MNDTLVVAAGLQAIGSELHLIRLALFALCPDKDKEALLETIEKADAAHAEALQEVSDALTREND